MASVFSPAYKVPDKLVAATPALRKKTCSIRGTAGVRRKHLMKELAKAKTKSKSRLTYMNPPAPRLEPAAPTEVPAEPAVATPAEELAETGPLRPEPTRRDLSVPLDVTYPSDDDNQVHVALLAPWPTLTEVLGRARLGARQGARLGPGPSARPSSALGPRPSVKSRSWHTRPMLIRYTLFSLRRGRH